MLHSIKAYEITWHNIHGEHSFLEFTKRTAENSVKRLEHFNSSMKEVDAQVYLTPAIKKEFQKIIKGIRESDFNETQSEYPKAIMTEAMMLRGEATIIFTWQGSYSYSTEYTKERAEKMMQVKSFTDFLNREQAKAQIELRDNNNYQIRIQF